MHFIKYLDLFVDRIFLHFYELVYLFRFCKIYDFDLSYFLKTTVWVDIFLVLLFFYFFLHHHHPLYPKWWSFLFIWRLMSAYLCLLSLIDCYFRYITYTNEEEALRCIHSVHGFILEGRPLRYHNFFSLCHVAYLII